MGVPLADCTGSACTERNTSQGESFGENESGGGEGRTPTDSPKSVGADNRTGGSDAPAVLIAEDDRINRMVITKLIQQVVPSAEILIAETGEQAVEVAETHDGLKLILMDIQMPVMDGLEASEQIRRHGQRTEAGEAVPIIALSAGTFGEDRERCYAAGMDDFIAKPIDLEQLRSVLLLYLSFA